MPAFNAGRFIKSSIESVLAQGYSNWELITVNDGSIDNTKEVIRSFTDRRIRYFEQENKGVSAARNLALENMRGEFFCFLDADDLLTPNSISCRIQLFQKEKDIGIVDGTVMVTKDDMQKVLRVYKPSISGRVIKNFALLSDKVFCGPSAMIRKEEFLNYAFDTEMTHAEDLWFLLNVHRQSKLLFASVSSPVLYYRRLPYSAMSNLDGLGNGYVRFYDHVKSNQILERKDLAYLKYKIAKIMFLSYARRGEIKKGTRYLRTFYFPNIS
jgi:teichuronic acid biosynthesis glycosyltransferase TuaG